MPASPKKPAPPVKAEPVDVLPAPVADNVIDQVYAEIRAIARDAGLTVAIAMGKIILEKFYGGEVQAWRDRGAKDASFRKLAARFDEDAPEGTSAAGLYRAVAIYELELRVGVSARKHLTATHVRAVIGLPDAKQEKLLADAETKGWSTRQLEEKAASIRKKEGDGRGRPPLPMFVKTIHRLERIVDNAATAFEGIDDIEEFDEDEARQLHEAVKDVMDKCELVQKALAKRAKKTS